MKFEFEHEIQVPFEEKTFILPQPRIKLFQNLIENYKVFCPEFMLSLILIQRILLIIF